MGEIIAWGFIIFVIYMIASHAYVAKTRNPRCTCSSGGGPTNDMISRNNCPVHGFRRRY